MILQIPKLLQATAYLLMTDHPTLMLREGQFPHFWDASLSDASFSLNMLESYRERNSYFSTQCKEMGLLQMSLSDSG